jgi:hypothetical protein
MFTPTLLQSRLARLMLRLNPQQVSYGVRTSASAANGTDSFTNYTLYQAGIQPATKDDLQLAGGGVAADEYRVWYLIQPDLDQAGAPVPQISFQLTDAGNVTWIIENVERALWNSAYRCLARKAR